MDGYKIIRTKERDKLNLDTGQVESGMDVTALDEQTNTQLTVFVPNENLDDANTKLLVEDKIARIRAIHNLGT